MFWKRKQPAPVVPTLGFQRGDIVRHKVDHEKAVVLDFEWYDDEQTQPGAVVAWNSNDNDGSVSLYEIEKAPKDEPPPSTS